MRLSLSAVVLGAIAAAILFPRVLTMSHIRAVSGLSPPKAEAQIRLFASAARTSKPFAVTFYIKNHQPGGVVRLIVPSGLRLVEGQQAERVVPAAGREGYSQIDWRLTAQNCGEYRLLAEIDGEIAEDTVNVREPTVCDF